MRERLAALFGITLVAVAVSAGPAAASPAPPWSRLRVMTLNIFYGGDDLDLASGEFCAVPDGCPQTLRELEKLIRGARADIVGVQEPERNVERIAADLGWYGSNRAHIMSRFPIIDPPGSNGLYVFVQVAPGRVVAVANTHLPSDPYGPYLVRDGGSLDEVIDLERQTRLPAVQDLVTVLPTMAAAGIPVVLTGDFNSPSQLDWTPAVAKVRSDVRYPVRWPAGAALAEAGLVDTFREAHPDPVRVPGFTWTPGGPETDAHEVMDRIDWVLRAGPTRTIDSDVVGVGLAPYPTDHRGMVSTLEVRAAVPPALVAPDDRRVTVGEPLRVTYHQPGPATGHLVLVDARGRVASSAAAGRTDGTVTLRTDDLARGQYAVRLQSARGEALSTEQVWFYLPGEGAQVSVDRPVVKAGQAIGVHFIGAPGMGLDWISIFRCTAAGCGANSEYLLYAYTGSKIEGRLSIGPDAIEGYGTWPLPPGRYVARLLPDDGLVSVAESAEFRITP